MDDKRDFLFRNTPLDKRALLLLDTEALYSVTDQYTANKYILHSKMFMFYC